MTDILYQYKTNIFGIIHMSISSWACVFTNFNAKKAPNKKVQLHLSWKYETMSYSIPSNDPIPSPKHTIPEL